MSRRSHHGRRPQTNTAAQDPASEPAADRPRGATATAVPPPDPSTIDADVAPVSAAAVPVAAGARAVPVVAPTPSPASPAGSVPVTAEPEAASAGDGEASRTTCTQAQLRRFIKSRPWIPMHELRRRFGIYGGDDEVTPVRVGNGTVFVGLPTAEGRMLGELLSAGDVGYELSLDPGAPIVVGVYPMRPVPRG